MPCSDDYSFKNELTAKKTRLLSERCDELAALLCSAGRAYWSKQEMPQDVLIWWEHHCELDKSRGELWDVEPKKVGVE